MSRRKSIFLSAQEAQPNPIHLEELSIEIDQNLRTLALIHPMSEIAKPILVKGAFLKANKSAFHYVVQYLVMLISAIDFRKRFPWPIVSPQEQSQFRSAALTYFNECHSNFKWNFGPFKQAIVLFPGGIDFMKIIVELSKHAMHIVLKENHSLHLMNERGVTWLEAQSKLQVAEECFELLEELRRKIQSLGEPLKEKTRRLKEFRAQLLKHSPIPEHHINDKFTSIWESNQFKTINDKIMPTLTVLDDFILKCDSFGELLTSKPQPIRFDKDKMNAFGLLRISQHFDPQIDFEKLIQWFKNAMPDLINATYFTPPWSLLKLQQESQIIDQWISRTDDLLARIDFLRPKLKYESSVIDTTTTSVAANYLSEKLIITPTVDCEPKRKCRITIWEAAPVIELPANMIQRSLIKINEDTIDASVASSGIGDCTVAHTISNKLDPMLILNTAMKRKGSMKPRGSPRQHCLQSSPGPLNSNNNLTAFNSTMISQKEPTFNGISPIQAKPLRKRLF